jgi:hypothetical protein
MGMGASQAQVKRRLRFLANKYCGVEFRVIYASNGETAILPVNPATGELECTDPAKFMPKEKSRYGTLEHKAQHNAATRAQCDEANRNPKT